MNARTSRLLHEVAARIWIGTADKATTMNQIEDLVKRSWNSTPRPQRGALRTKLAAGITN